MDSIGNVLQGLQPKEPPQLQALRSYVRERHGVAVAVSISTFGYTLTVPNAPLASTLRMELPQIKAVCQLDKKLFIRIGFVEQKA
jgi:hypothetical protein